MSRSPSPHMVLALQAGLVSQVLLGQDPFEICHNSHNKRGEQSWNCDPVDSMPQQELSFKDLATDFLLGGVFGALIRRSPRPLSASIL